MSYKMQPAPHIRATDYSTHMHLDVFVALLPLCIYSTVHYGPRPVLLVLAGMVAAVLSEAVACLFMWRRLSALDGSAAVTGALIGALVSPLSPYWLPALGAVFAILVAKMPFGGAGRYVFNPAAAGLAVMTQCFAVHLFTYPDPGRNVQLPLGEVTGIIPVLSPAAQLAQGGDSVHQWSNLLLGNFPGPIGATAIAVLLTGALYLFLRRTASPLITLPYLITCALIAALFPRVSGGLAGSVLLELCSGYLMFAGVFLLADPVTAPRSAPGRVVYGVLAAVLVMLLRHVGRFEEGACFAVLLVNAFAPVIDRTCWQFVHAMRRKKGGARS